METKWIAICIAIVISSMAGCQAFNEREKALTERKYIEMGYQQTCTEDGWTWSKLKK